jgi:uracil-DNA glycosylase
VCGDRLLAVITGFGKKVPMGKSNLVPFLRENLDVLFVGLNPAQGSSRNRHYFSVNQALWNQLYDAGLITSRVDKSNADKIVFGRTDCNFQGWSYGVTDLITAVAESDSSRVKPTQKDCDVLQSQIKRFGPKVAILLHGKVLDSFLPYLGYAAPSANTGKLGILIKDCPTMFFNIAFPHGNAIASEYKVAHYRAVKQYLLKVRSK